MSTYQYNKIGSRKMATLKRNVDRVAPLLELSGEWDVYDVDQDVANDILFLHRNSAIEKVRKVDKHVSEDVDWDTERTRPRVTIHIWRWNPRVKKELQDHLENRDNFPCGHRKHLFNLRDKDGFGCRYCKDDETKEMPEYSREQIEDWL